MNFNGTLKQIAAGNLSQIYFLYGQENYLLRKAEKAIIDAVLGAGEQSSNLTLFHGDPDLKELIYAIEAIPFFGDKSLVVVRETALFKAGGKAEAADSGKDAKQSSPLGRLTNLLDNMPAGSYLVFTSSHKSDKRRKIYKTVEKSGIIIEANPLKGRELREWLYERLGELGLEMAPDAKEHLLVTVSLMPQVSLDFIDNELLKVSLYTQKSPLVTLSMLKEVLAKVPEVSIFAMIEALGQKNLTQALRLYKEQVSAGKHPVQVIALLAKHTRQLLTAKELSEKGFSNRQMADYFKLPVFIVEKLDRQSRSFSRSKLEEAIVHLATTDHMLKSGRSGPYALEQAMIELCL